MEKMEAMKKFIVMNTKEYGSFLIAVKSYINNVVELELLASNSQYNAENIIFEEWDTYRRYKFGDKIFFNDPKQGKISAFIEEIISFFRYVKNGEFNFKEQLRIRIMRLQRGDLLFAVGSSLNLPSFVELNCETEIEAELLYETNF